MLKKYHAKVLLFGEYAVLEGSEALASPLQDFYGYWSQNEAPKDGFHTAELDIDAFCAQIQKYIDAKLLQLNISKFKDDWNTGWRFHSNIPSGYGLGSSGAFTASVYDLYAKDNFDGMSPNKVQRHLALLESYFHGESSGMDPTVSIYNMPIHSASNWNFIKHDVLEPIKDEGLRFFLFDSEEERATKNLISKFKTLSIDPTFRDNVLRPISKINANAIAHTLKGEAALWDDFVEISQLQLHHFDQMISDEMEGIWAKCILEDAPHRFKICGAGGGGYYLGLSNNIDATLRALRVDRVILL